MKTKDLLKKLGVTTANANKYCDALDETMSAYSINTAKRQAMFIAQILHESGLLSRVVENLNYSGERLHVVFPKYFPTQASADAYARQPEKIANRVYANRLGNGNEASGDGYRFRGRGAIQLTGRSNYNACGGQVGHDLIKDPAWLETPEGALKSAAWFWSKNGLNTLADAGDIVAATKRINGGTNGLNDRKALYAKALALI